MPILTNQATAAYKVGAQNFSGLSNVTNFNLFNASLTLVKSQNISGGVSGDVVTFTILATNTDIALPVTNLVITDDLTAQGFNYVAGTAKIDGVSTADSPQTGIAVGTIAPLGLKTITFNATVN